MFRLHKFVCQFALLVATLVFFGGTFEPVWAQTATTGAITGVVTDPSGAVMPNVRVILTNVGTSATRETATDAQGTYSFSLLEPGQYTMTYALTGFATLTSQPLTVNVTETDVLSPKMQVGSSQESVTVQAGVELVQTESTTLGTLVSDTTITNIPLTTRNYTQVLSLSPGVVANVTNAATLGKNSEDVYVNGSNNVSNNYQMDGADINNLGTGRADSWLGYGGISIPNPDALEEFKIQTTLYDAGYGRGTGANVNVVTKSGTDQFHGDVWEFLRNNVLDANDFFLNSFGQSRPTDRQNQFGGTIGGPIKKGKLFFFGSYQGTRQVNGYGANSLSEMVLPPLTNDRSAATLAKEFCGKSGTFGGAAITCGATNNINPTALAILNYKLPNGIYYIPTPQTILPNGTGLAAFSLPSTYHQDQFMINSDYRINSTETLSERFFYSRDPELVNFTVQNMNPGSGGNDVFNNRNAVVKLTSLLSPNLVNEGLFAFSRTSGTTKSLTPITDAAAGITPGDPNYANEIPIGSVSGLFSWGGNFNDDFITAINQFQLSDQISWAHGRHTIRGGFTFERIQDNFFLPGPLRGLLVFTSFPDFLLGESAAQNGSPFSNVFLSFGISGEMDRAFRVNNYSSFVQDDIKVSPRLTLNVGLRWEVNGGVSDIYGRLANFWPSLAGGVPPASGTYAGFTVPANYKLPIPSGIVRRDNDTAAMDPHPLHNVGPRIGAAWRPFNTDRFVVRSGYGIYFDRTQANAVLQLLLEEPFVGEGDLAGASNAAATFQVPFNPRPTTGSFQIRTPTTKLSNSTLAENYDSPMIQQWSLDTQYEFAHGFLLDVAYVGNHGTRLGASRQLNEPLLASTADPIHGITTNTVANAAERVPYLGFAPTGLSDSETYGFSMYNALQAGVGKQLRHGLSFQVSYTYSNAMTDVTGVGLANVFTGGSSNFDDTNIRSERWGPADFDRRHRVIFYYSWNIPGTHGDSGFLQHLTNGWRFSGVTTLQSGDPLTITDSTAGSIYAFASTSGAELCPGMTNASAATSGSVESRLNNYLNPAAFCAPPTIGDGTGYGNVARGIVRGPGQNNWDMSIAKETTVGGLSEGARLEFRTEFFNAFNHAQFADPGVAFGTPAFGIINSTSVNPRLIQFALKYIF